jgi:hypothetical protein
MCSGFFSPFFWPEGSHGRHTAGILEHKVNVVIFVLSSFEKIKKIIYCVFMAMTAKNSHEYNNNFAFI